MYIQNMERTRILLANDIELVEDTKIFVNGIFMNELEPDQAKRTMTEIGSAIANGCECYRIRVLAPDKTIDKYLR